VHRGMGPPSSSGYAVVVLLLHSLIQARLQGGEARLRLTNLVLHKQGKLAFIVLIVICLLALLRHRSFSGTVSNPVAVPSQSLVGHALTGNSSLTCLLSYLDRLLGAVQVLKIS